MAASSHAVPARATASSAMFDIDDAWSAEVALPAMAAPAPAAAAAAAPVADVSAAADSTAAPTAAQMPSALSAIDSDVEAVASVIESEVDIQDGHVPAASASATAAPAASESDQEAALKPATSASEVPALGAATSEAPASGAPREVVASTQGDPDTRSLYERVGKKMWVTAEECPEATDMAHRVSGEPPYLLPADLTPGRRYTEAAKTDPNWREEKILNGWQKNVLQVQGSTLAFVSCKV